MMKMKLLIPLFLITGLCLVGCGTDDAADDTSPQLDPNRNQTEPAETNNKLGFVRYTKDEFANDESHEHRAITIDRREMADMISRILLQNNQYEEVATLVTDEEVLIAFEHSENIAIDEAMINARKTAESVLPRYYDIYTSGDKSLIQDIQTLHYSLANDPNFDYDQTVQTIIEEMKQDGTPDDE
ncbi:MULTISPECIES: YhcN/YlaJ family sporulation lipoprotein [Oceanobacillus]|uniref:Lipoprotein YutC n=1 Tax=Oceanobacillus kimchii TaxID=746691 RepID=A0ABQ5TMN9_9BACI|nr:MULTISPECIES: YhcN/YlaJ family sporulation lipoprotein [Oceanobacillus]MBT2601187.1 YhcN/YlaJ family sporulation lipoprotein [Oceanobacillus sp. ISL-74]MBT2652412.1 YhcN/YlaJ family sporulation lipoprotein [Oceanobacillus sp. ISL-73]MCT1579076.1 YhcN/YlaJ family sporulation lipoprotein [Oceanobacillus kimchii]MCT2137396.1 YhcN/YlaJ family sporulation lipoprotein [Oceanobacillus kimchii]OEH54016.1 hypothetical protein AQ616_09520 [Oceanobacillus sp. E9]